MLRPVEYNIDVDENKTAGLFLFTQRETGYLVGISKNTPESFGEEFMRVIISSVKRTGKRMNSLFLNFLAEDKQAEIVIENGSLRLKWFRLSTSELISNEELNVPE